MELAGLIEASCLGDREAFSNLVRRYQGLVCSVTYSFTGDVGQSEDLAQETFVAAWQHLADLRDPQKLPAWLCGIARNVARNALRRRGRDPLARSEELGEQLSSRSDGPADALDQAERLALVWDTLERIPEEYREPLIMFYREGQSIHAVSDALEISEDCARQRLSRGRKMLKAQVAALVEATLEGTRPDAAFTAAVVGALPLMTMPAGAALGSAGAAKGAALAGKGVTGAKVLAGTSAGMMSGLLGAAIGATGGFFGMWAGIRNSATLRMRRYMLKCFALTYAFIWLFLGYESMCGVLFWPRPTFMFTLCGVGWALYVPALFCLIVFTNRKAMRLAREDAGQLPAPGPLEQSELSLRRVWLSLGWTLPLAVLGSAGTVMWIHSMPWTRSGWPFILALAILCHCTFVEMFRRGARIARDEDAFLAHPPSPSSTLEMILEPRRAQGPSKKALFYNDLFALAGSIFGPMAMFIVEAIRAGNWPLAGLVDVVCTLALLFGLWMRRTPEGRRRGLLIVCLFMGIFSAAIIVLTGQESYPIEMFPGAPEVPRYFIAAIPLALYWCIGLALFVTLKKRNPSS